MLTYAVRVMVDYKHLPSRQHVTPRPTPPPTHTATHPAHAVGEGGDAGEGGGGHALGAASEWRRGVGGAEVKEECDTGGWAVVYRGEVVLAMPPAVACKLLTYADVC
jgi:hypothetical protein